MKRVLGDLSKRRNTVLVNSQAEVSTLNIPGTFRIGVGENQEVTEVGSSIDSYSEEINDEKEWHTILFQGQKTLLTLRAQESFCLGVTFNYM